MTLETSMYHVEEQRQMDPTNSNSRTGIKDHIKDNLLITKRIKFLHYRVLDCTREVVSSQI